MSIFYDYICMLADSGKLPLHVAEAKTISGYNRRGSKDSQLR
jgi:hypothetical protein